MHARTLAIWMMTLSLVFAVAHTVLAEEAAAPAADAPAEAAPAPTMGKIGPGAPPAAAPKAAKAAKAAPAAKGIALAPVTPVASSVNVHDKVLEECHLQTLLPQAIAQRNTDVVLKDGAGSMKLELKIVDIHAPNGGWFSGPKWITVEGRLLQGKTIKGNFVAKETSMASATACGMLTKVINVLGEDIATWLSNPKKNDHIGRAR